MSLHMDCENMQSDNNINVNDKKLIDAFLTCIHQGEPIKKLSK